MVAAKFFETWNICAPRYPVLQWPDLPKQQCKNVKIKTEKEELPSYYVVARPLRMGISYLTARLNYDSSKKARLLL